MATCRTSDLSESPDFAAEYDQIAANEAYELSDIADAPIKPTFQTVPTDHREEQRLLVVHADKDEKGPR